MLELVSVHFPKAAGTSLGTALKCAFGDRLLFDYDHAPGNPSHNLYEEPALPTQIKAVHGHFRPDRYCGLNSKHTITFLRNPVHNLISIYYFWTSFPPHGNPLHDNFIAEKPSIFQFAKHSPLRRLMADLYFSGIDMQLFDFVGFYEHLTKDINALSILLNLPIVELRENETKSVIDDQRSEILQNEKAMGALTDLLADDVAFYEKLLGKRGG